MKSSDGGADGAGDGLTAIFDCLASNERRRLLERLYDRAPTPVPRGDLAIALTATNEAPDRVTDQERERALHAIHHVHAPKLEAAGLITPGSDGDGVALADHPAYRDTGLVEAITGDASAGTASLDALFRALADARRRTVLDVLSHQYQPIGVETLARDVVASRRETTTGDLPPEEHDRIHRSLRHRELPHLQRAGLVEYDADEGTVVYEGHPDLRVPWMHSELGPGFRERLTDTPGDAEVRNIDGREEIVSCGQSICEEADDELFLLFTTTGLVEAGCLSRIEQAADRGVNVSLGTADPAVREFVEAEAPSVTLWEPETNWLDLPVHEENVGRLVFADRELVMIGTLGEASDDGVREEQAIVGEGRDNALVVLIRQLLGSRLDRFDDLDDEAEAKLPF